MACFVKPPCSANPKLAKCRLMPEPFVMGKEQTQQTSATTLGDVLYAKSKALVLEQEWTILVRSIAAGDQHALHALYERAHRLVFTLIMRITANRDIAPNSPSMSFMTSGGAPRTTSLRTARCSPGS
jgi:hypothetical protein